MLVNPKYQIVLFKDKVKKKIIKKFNNFKNCENFFNLLMEESNKVIFPKQLEGTVECKFELGILQDGYKSDIPQYTTDEFGRNVKIQLIDNKWGLIKVSVYNQEEKIYDIKNKKKVTVPQVISKYLRGDGLKMINSLHNKIIIQKDDDFSVFTTKSPSETSRLLDCLTEHFIKSQKKDCLIVKDTSTAQKKYLIDFLSSNGFDKKLLYRQYTTFPR